MPKSQGVLSDREGREALTPIAGKEITHEHEPKRREDKKRKIQARRSQVRLHQM